MRFAPLGMSVARFLREHWQRRPLLVRGALADFVDPLSPEELAGLACEDGVESRVVRARGGARPWEVTFGPHPPRRFRALPDRGWTLLVQELNRHVPEAALLLDRFAFVPNVRVDDVMVSYAAKGGSVGPHVDSYDVFLVQGAGHRRWRYGTKSVHHARFKRGLDLRILERFEWHEEAVLERGDVLYLPPGFAHHGVAVTPCLTYSVGFRAPGIGEMWKDFAARAAALEGGAILADPQLAASEPREPGEIPVAMLANVRRAVRAIDSGDDAIDRWFASFATRLAPGHAIEPPPRPPRDLEARLSGPRARARVARTEEGRFAFLPRARPRGALYLYAGGIEIDVPARAADLARLVCRERRFDGAALLAASPSKEARALLAHLFAMGALTFASPTEASRR